MQAIVRLRRESRGASAIEFALIAPTLIMIYVATVEIGSALTVYRRTAQIAATAADLTAQVKTVTKTDVKDILAASSSILAPYSTKPLSIVISSVVANDSNQGKVSWSCASTGAARSAGSNYNVPNGLTEANSSVIVTEVTYAYTGLLGLTEFFNPGSFDMKRVFYTRPRRSSEVAKTDNGC
jgi:Flp pilus assembly protein TadG